MLSRNLAKREPLCANPTPWAGVRVEEPPRRRLPAFRTSRTDFVTAEPSRKGPVSNTGLNPLRTERLGVSVDYLTLVFSESAAERCGQSTRTILGWLFGRTFQATELKAKMWQFYKLSAYIVDGQGEVVGRIGKGGNGDTWCVSLTGKGCAQVDNWDYTYMQALYLDAHLSRIDVAFDDLDGQIFNDIRRVDGLARSGAFWNGQGRPPRTHFIDDHDGKHGCTVYVGAKGRKELCVYEKGKALGDEASPWVRCELRLWRSNGHIPLDAMLRCHEFLVGAYDVLRDLIPVDCEGSRPETTKAEISATAESSVGFLREQCGPLLWLLYNVLGDDRSWFFDKHVLRPKVPKRFKGRGYSPEQLIEVLRAELSPRIDPPF